MEAMNHYLEIEACVKCPDTNDWTPVRFCEYECTCFDEFTTTEEKIMKCVFRHPFKPWNMVGWKK